MLKTPVVHHYQTHPLMQHENSKYSVYDDYNITNIINFINNMTKTTGKLSVNTKSTYQRKNPQVHHFFIPQILCLYISYRNILTHLRYS